MSTDFGEVQHWGNVLRGLKEIYTEVARSKRVPVDVSEASRIDTIRQLDEKIVAPYFGFDDAEDYWHKMSVGPRLRELSKPCLFIASENDPMVFAHTIRPLLPDTKLLKSVFTPHGGHVFFPNRIDLGLGSTLDVYSQALQWMRAQN